MPEQCHTALLNESQCHLLGRHSPPSIVAYSTMMSRVLRALPFASAPPPRPPSIVAWCHEARE
jgi:hypothetical protein